MTTTAKKPAVRRGAYGVVVVSSAVGAVVGTVTAAALAARPTVAGVPLVVWLLVVLGAGALTAVLDGALRWARARWGPTRGGWAGGPEVDAELSRRALRRIATWTRPSLAGNAGRRAVPPGELGYTAHRWCGRRVWVPWEGSGAILAPRSEQRAQAMVPVALAAPGPLLVAGVTPELAAAIVRHRAGRAGVSGARVVGTDAVVGAPGLRWSLLAGCTDHAVARRRAAAMIAATPTSPALCPPGSALDDATADRRARTLAIGLLAGYLLAAARTGVTGLDALVGWITARGPEPARLLAEHTDPSAVTTDPIAPCPPATRERAWRHLEAAVRPLQDPTVRARWAATPQAGDALADLVADGSTLILTGDRVIAPLLTAVATAWIDAARAATVDGRLDPPAVAVLGELAELTPIPDLPAAIRGASRQGVLIHWSAESLVELMACYGGRATELVVATTTLDVRAGVTDVALLGWVAWRAAYAGEKDRRPECSVTDLREIRAGRAVLVHRNLPPLRTHPIHNRLQPHKRALWRLPWWTRAGA